jgi:Bacteriophytochrome (light-regulated signal transduction histidine kinase)
MARSLGDGFCRDCCWRFKGRLVALAMAGALAANWGWQTLRDRTIDLAQAESLATSLARAAEYQIDGSVRSIATFLDEAADRIDPAHWPDGALEDWFSARLAGFPEIRNIVLTDADGHTVGTIRRPGQMLPGWSEDLSDREYFANSAKQFPAETLYIPQPVVSRFSIQASIPISRAIAGPDGGFAGLVIAGVDPESFRRKLDSVLIEDEGAAGLFRTDGIILARSPNHAQFLGRSIAASPLFTEFLPGAPSGIARLVAMADGNDKIVSYRTLANYPLVVTVGITTRTALARWSRQMRQEAIVLGLAVATLFGLAWAYDLRAEASRRLNEELQRQKDLLERQVEERTAHLAATNAELEQFAYIASHDLQEPLRTITGFLQLLSRRYHGKLDGEGEEFIAFAVNGAKRMSLLINDLLAFSRVGRNEEAAEACDCAALAHGALEGLAQAMAECGAQVEVAPLPKARCRPAQVQSLFQNLIGNAIKYRAPDRTPQVEVWAEPDKDGMVRFAVSDNGIGIDPQYHERVFGIFQRLHARDRYEGTGIGLALCRKIVERHGGRIWLTSEPDKGTTMWFTLPAA